jgi:hypothetical protein
MFLSVVIVLFIISFFLALRALRSLGEKPKIESVKRSLDKSKIIYHSRTSSSGE